MSDPAKAPIDEAAAQLASWLLHRLGSGGSSVADAVERRLPGALPGKEGFVARLGKAANLLRRTEAELAARLSRDRWFRDHGADRVRPWRLLPSQPTMVPRWPGLPLLHDLSGVADWLGYVPIGELEWMAGLSFREPEPDSRRGHYTHRWVPRTQGPPRLLASPKPKLKAIQHSILRGILDRVPMHEAAHGFRSGRSIRTFAEPHVGQACVLRADLADFFPSIRFGRVAAFFETAGYPAPVAAALAGLCCHSAPRVLVREARLPARLASVMQRPHLPQGAPTSPALSNAIAFRLDRRLAGLATAAGARYTRYADDLAFSGGDEVRRCARRFLDRVAEIVLDEGFALNYRKTRVMPSCLRQRIAGVVVNERTNTVRPLYDELKAILHRWETRGWNACAGDDPVFAERLRGRIAALSMLNPEKGAKLRVRFDRLEARGC